MIHITNKDRPDFLVVWDVYFQKYTVYYKGKILIDNKYKFSDVKSYLD